MGKEELRRRFSALDAVFVEIESDTAPMHIGSVFVYDGRIPVQRFRADVASKLHLIPRYRQRMMPAPLDIGFPTWEFDPHFNLSRHITLRRLAKPGNDTQLRRISAEILSRKLPLDRPLWEIVLVHGLEGGRSAAITKVHHCLVDGVSGVDLVRVLLDPSPIPVRRKGKHNASFALPGSKQRFVDALWDDAIDEVARWTDMERSFARFAERLGRRHIAATVREVAGTLKGYAGPIDRMPFNVHSLSGKKSLAWSEYSFAEGRAIRTALGGTVNDVVLTVVSGAVRAYVLAHRGDPEGRVLRVMVPVSLRGEEERGQMGNRVSMLPVRIPLDITDPVERFHAISEHTTRLKEAHIAEGLYTLMRAGQGIPMLQAWAGRMARSEGVTTLLSMISSFPLINTVCTNVPGPQIPLYTLGHKLVSYYPFLPVFAEVAVNFGVLSYNQKLAVTIIADRAGMRDIDRMKALLDHAFVELREAAGVKERPRTDLAHSRSASPRTRHARNERHNPVRVDHPQFKR